MTTRLKIARPGLALIAVASFVVCGGLGSSARAAPGTMENPFGGFAPGWQKSWQTRGFPFTRATTYHVEPEGEGGRLVLRADATNANRALLYRSRIVAPKQATLSWRWKVQAPLMENRAERRRRGDDYAARVFVVFETSPFPLQTVAINYVWAAHEPVGSRYPSPYASRVQMVVLQSGLDRAGQWSAESRDILQDYRDLFGREPTEINGVAVMVDTDNTGAKATAWFEALHLEINPTPAHSQPRLP